MGLTSNGPGQGVHEWAPGDNAYVYHEDNSGKHGGGVAYVPLRVVKVNRVTLTVERVDGRQVRIDPCHVFYTSDPTPFDDEVEMLKRWAAE